MDLTKQTQSLRDRTDFPSYECVRYRAGESPPEAPSEFQQVLPTQEIRCCLPLLRGSLSGIYKRSIRSYAAILPLDADVCLK